MEEERVAWRKRRQVYISLRPSDVAEFTRGIKSVER